MSESLQSICSNCKYFYTMNSYGNQMCARFPRHEVVSHDHWCGEFEGNKKFMDEFIQYMNEEMMNFGGNND